MSSLHLSNSRISQILKTLKRNQNSKQWGAEVIKFYTVGFINLLVDTGIFNLLLLSPHNFFRVHYLLAGAISTFVAILSSWVLNRNWTFAKKGSQNRFLEFLTFFLVNLIGMAIALSCLLISHDGLGFTSVWADNLSKNGVGLILGMIFRYLMYRYFIFNNDKTV